jgi:ankyrin repeat protein
MIAAENGDLNRVREQLEKGDDVNARSQAGHTALMLAAAAGHLEVVKALLNAKADPNVRAFTFHGGEFLTLMAAMNRCNKDWEKIPDVMVEARAEVNPKAVFSNSPLMYAITRYDPVLVKALIARGADVNLKNHRGTTPLMTAVMSRGSTVENVKLLLAAGADANARDNEGKTALAFVDIYVKEKTERAELSRLLRKHQ